jgi:hypothetical protein
MAVVAVTTAAACCGSAAVAACRSSAAVAACCGSAAVAAHNGSVAVTTCCDPATAAAPREPSLAAVAVLSAALDALDERRLVGTDASDLNTLASARGARWAPPCERENEKVKLSLISKMRRMGERSPTLGWRVPASSSSEARRTLWPRPAWPPPHPQSSPRHAPVPPRRASPLS